VDEHFFFIRRNRLWKKITINLISGLNPDIVPIHKHLVLSCGDEYRLLYAHHIQSDADIAYNRKWF